MASRLKRGLNEACARMEVAGHAHGTSSLVHLTLRDCDCDREVCTMPHREIGEAAGAARTVPLKRALMNAGVDVMGRGIFIVLAAHREQDVDRTVAAFEEALAGYEEGRGRLGGPAQVPLFVDTSEGWCYIWEPSDVHDYQEF